MSEKRNTLKELDVLAVDCQATHSNPDKGYLLEIGWLKTRASEAVDFEKISLDVKTFLLKILRRARIPKAVWRVTGISHEELKSAQAPKRVWESLSKAAKDITDNISKENARQIKRNTTLQTLAVDNNAACPTIVHFGRYEEPFLRTLHKKYGPKEDFSLSIICTHEIVKRILPGLPRKSLRAVAGYFGQSLPESRRSQHHVAATALIWSHLVERLEDTHAITTFDELQEWLRQPIALPHSHKSSREYPLAEQYRKGLPDQPGIYRMYRSGGDLLYIGKAKNLKQRVNSYFHKSSRHPEHILEMLSQAQSLDTTITRTAFESALIESDEIKRYSPSYNRALQRNERNVLFFSRDLKSVSPQPTSCHSIGPLSSSCYLNSLALLGDVLDRDFRKISEKEIEGILNIPSEFRPDRDCFISGLKDFKEEFKEWFHPAFEVMVSMSLGAKFWKEKLEEQSAEEAAKKNADGAAVTGKKALRSEINMEALGEDVNNESEAEEILELKIQASGEVGILNTWTPERVLRVVKSIIRLGAFAIRRSRWFCRLSESSLVWTPEGGDSGVRNLVVFKGGVPLFKDPLPSSEKVPLPPWHKKPLVERQKGFDLLVYDRMRVTTTEIRRLVQEGRKVELWLHPDVCLRSEQLKRMLRWV